MKILFLGDIVGNSGCQAIKDNLPSIIKNKKIDFVVVNGENAAKEGVGITENNTNERYSGKNDEPRSCPKANPNRMSQTSVHH